MDEIFDRNKKTESMLNDMACCHLQENLVTSMVKH